MKGGFFIETIIMRKEELPLRFEVYDSLEELSPADAELMKAAREVTAKAYAPYSNFLVGAVAELNSGEKVSGTNQENASYPVGLCAERVLLSTASMLHTGEPVKTMAVAYNNLHGDSNTPVSPCGMCRQYIAEYEERVNQPIRLILGGMKGKVIILQQAGWLLPLSFGSKDLK